MRDAQWLAEVVRPLIEAQVREAVAQELEQQPCTEHGAPQQCPKFRRGRANLACIVESATWRKAAAVARGVQP